MTICPYQTCRAPYPKSTQFFRKITFHPLSGVSRCPLPSGPVRWALYLLPNPKNLAKSGVETSNEISCGAKICPIVLGFTSLANKVLPSSDWLAIYQYVKPVRRQLPPIAGRKLEKVPSFLSMNFWASNMENRKVRNSTVLLISLGFHTEPPHRLGRK